MPDLSVSEAQLERLEEVRVDLEAVYVGEYGTVQQADALEYLLDTYTPPDDETDASADAEGKSAPELEELTEIDGVGEATADSLAAAGFPSISDVAAADPESLAEIGGIGREQAVDIAASAAAIDTRGSSERDVSGDAEKGEGSDSDDSADPETESEATAPGGDPSDSPEDTLQRAMSLLEANEDRWRESENDTPYEVDLPDGSTEGVRTKDDVKRLLFKHWR